jgi:hypothetical protein
MNILLTPLMIISYQWLKESCKVTYYLSKISHNSFPNIKCNDTTTTEIERIMTSIKVKNSHGYDGITTKMLSPLLFLLYINYLPKIANDNAEVVLYVDDTSIIITSFNPTDFTNSANKINLLSLNADKTQYMKSAAKTSSLIDLHVMYTNKEIANTSNTTFLGLTLDNTFLEESYRCKNL